MVNNKDQLKNTGSTGSSSQDRLLSRSRNTSKRGRPAISADKKRKMRAKIAASTQLLFQSSGYRQISMRRIAKEVGCSPMTLYQYYDAKIDILHTLWEGIFDSVFQKVNASQSHDESPRQRLKTLASSYVNYWLDNTDHYRLVFMTEGVEQPDVSIFVDNVNIIANYQVFLEAISNSYSKQPSVDELRVKLDTMICFLHGIAHNLITISGYDWSSTDSLVDAAVRAVVD